MGPCLNPRISRSDTVMSRFSLELPISGVSHLGCRRQEGRLGLSCSLLHLQCWQSDWPRVGDAASSLDRWVCTGLEIGLMGAPASREVQPPKNIYRNQEAENDSIHCTLYTKPCFYS